MDKNKNEMTDEQKKIYYVTKISRLSSEEYKLTVGTYVGIGIGVLNFFAQGIFPAWTISPAMATTASAIAVYCLIAEGINHKQQKEAYDELAKLNKTEGKNR